MEGKVVVSTTQAGDNVVLKLADSTFGGIAVVETC
jgi:hypothetical protein